MNNYLRSFIIGSSLPVFISFFLRVATLDNKIKNYSYKSYSIIAPLYLGLMNMISLCLTANYNIPLRRRLIIIGIISPIIVILFAKLIGSYNFTRDEWIKYSIKLLIKHFLIYNTVIYFLEKNV